MKSFLNRIDNWLQSIFIVEEPVGIQQNIREEELLLLYRQYGNDETAFRNAIRQLLDERLTEKVTEKHVNYCVLWAKVLYTQQA